MASETNDFADALREHINQTFELTPDEIAFNETVGDYEAQVKQAWREERQAAWEAILQTLHDWQDGKVSDDDE